ncbi:Fur family transcriptional regulator [Quadrisphaera setariae]|uniref:Transcriptional repressor n=1 Tax=Quadrisphaera setariae TaxID=2593304 RepID=A0A5C8ZDA3_9ACTN|nr:transcriptional repressor [Quadrisphaera setariae]TXR55128.1 transcriptional repressor [Quadrisphaera setariae]
MTEEAPARNRPAQRRTGRQRAAVAAMLDSEPAFTSAQDLYARLREQGNPIGLATVYRALQALVEDGEVDVLRTGEDGEAVYRRCSTGHHHHLVCRRCGRAEEVEGSAVEAWARKTAAAHGFTDVDHVVEIFGTCADCAAAR